MLVFKAGEQLCDRSDVTELPICMSYRRLTV